MLSSHPGGHVSWIMLWNCTHLWEASCWGWICFAKWMWTRWCGHCHLTLSYLSICTSILTSYLTYLSSMLVYLFAHPCVCLSMSTSLSLCVCVKTESNGIWSISYHNTNIYRCIDLYIQTVFGPYTTAGPFRAVWFWASCAGLFLWHHISPSPSLQVASAGIP